MWPQESIHTQQAATIHQYREGAKQYGLKRVYELKCIMYYLELPARMSMLWSFMSNQCQCLGRVLFSWRSPHRSAIFDQSQRCIHQNVCNHLKSIGGLLKCKKRIIMENYNSPANEIISPTLYSDSDPPRYGISNMYWCSETQKELWLSIRYIFKWYIKD